MTKRFSDRTATAPSHQSPSNSCVRAPAPPKRSPVLGRPGPRDGVRALFTRGTRSKSAGPPSSWWFPGCPPARPGPRARVPARVPLVHRHIHSSRDGFRHRHRFLFCRAFSQSLKNSLSQHSQRFWELHLVQNLLCSRGVCRVQCWILVVFGVTLRWRSCIDLSWVVCVSSESHYAISGWVLKPIVNLRFERRRFSSHIHIRMAGRRVTWRRLVVIHSNTLVSDENLSLGWENDEESMLRNPLRPQPRIPLRDITHLFPGNVSFWPYYTSFSLQSLIVQWCELMVLQHRILNVDWCELLVS